MFLKMQDFDFTQILITFSQISAKFAQICPNFLHIWQILSKFTQKNLLKDAAAFPTHRHCFNFHF